MICCLVRHDSTRHAVSSGIGFRAGWHHPDGRRDKLAADSRREVPKETAGLSLKWGARLRHAVRRHRRSDRPPDDEEGTECRAMQMRQPA